MSASLVGSEMCIRDRSQRAHRANSTYSATRTPSNNRTEWSIESIESIPVSYTHLTLPTICSV
eukprot:10927327-Alexandrium_andersonii.AAC.1